MTDDTTHTRQTDAQHENQPPASVREGLRDATTPLATTDPTADPDGDGIAAVAARMADAAVVGLGEATHGTREFFQLKHRIIRRLVTAHGVRAVAMEANLPEAMALHDYVVHGEGDPREALGDVYFWTWQVESVLELVEWLRAFNADRPREDRVELYGVDAQYTHGAVQRLRDHLDAVDPSFLGRIDDDLAALDDGGERLQWNAESAAAFAAAERVLPALRDHLDERRGTHVAATSERAWERARRYVTVLERAVELAETADDDETGGEDDEAADEGEPDIEAIETSLAVRDGAMADNVAWLRDHTDADTLVVWAHDAHLTRGGYVLPDIDVAAPSMGSHLTDRYGEDYYALGFAFAGGAFQAMHEDEDGEYELAAVSLDGPLPGTVEAALDGFGDPLAFVDLRAANADERTADWLGEPHPQFRTGATYDPDAPADQLVEYVYPDTFDGLCFVRETTRARPIDGVDERESEHDGGDGDGEESA